MHSSALSQQMRCYLCETPKRDYALVHVFSEVVCRSCLNFEGSDRLEEVLADARRSKQSRPSAREQLLTDLSGKSKQVLESNNINLLQSSGDSSSNRKCIQEAHQKEALSDLSSQSYVTGGISTTSGQQSSITSESAHSYTTQTDPMICAPTNAAAVNIPQILPYLLANGHFFPSMRPNDHQLSGLQNYNANCMIDASAYGRFLQMSAAAATAAMNPSSTSSLTGIFMPQTQTQIAPQVDTTAPPVAHPEEGTATGCNSSLARREPQGSTQTSKASTKSVCCTMDTSSTCNRPSGQPSASPAKLSYPMTRQSHRSLDSMQSTEEEATRQAYLIQGSSLSSTTASVGPVAHRVGQKTSSEKSAKSKVDAGSSIRSRLRAKLLDQSHKQSARESLLNPGSTYTGNCSEGDPMQIRKSSPEVCSRSSSVQSVDSDEAHMFGLLRRVATMSKDTANNETKSQAARHDSMSVDQLSTRSNSALDPKQSGVPAQQVHPQKEQTAQQPEPTPQNEAPWIGSIMCLNCNVKLEDKHFVQCPTVVAHKFCFSCTKVSIEAQRSECKRLNLVDRVLCPSGKKCFHTKEQSPWTFMISEIDTIIRESKTNGKAISRLNSDATNSGALNSFPDTTTATTTTTTTTTTAKASTTTMPTSTEEPEQLMTNSMSQCTNNKHSQQSGSYRNPMIDKNTHPHNASEPIKSHGTSYTSSNLMLSRYRKSTYLSTTGERAVSLMHHEESRRHNPSSRLDFQQCQQMQQQQQQPNNRTINDKQSHTAQASTRSPSSPGSSSAYHSSSSPVPMRLSMSADDSSDSSLSDSAATKRLAVDVYASRGLEINNKHRKT